MNSILNPNGRCRHSFLILFVVVWCVFDNVIAESERIDADPQSWMTQLSDDRRLSELSIPGTHNSGALFEPLKGTAACQNMTIAQQLNAGVRFFDIRCRHENDKFTIYHGPVFQKQTYDGIQKTASEYLDKYPREIILFSVKQEHSPRNISRQFADTMRTYIDNKKTLYHTENNIPRLKEVRGKIVLLRRFPATESFGIDATNWGHGGAHQSRDLFIQDRFEPASAENKWGLIKKTFQYSSHPDKDNLLFLNFTSGYVKNVLGIPNIHKISAPINNELIKYLDESRQTQLGCVITDFMTPELSQAIYQHNFIKENK